MQGLHSFGLAAKANEIKTFISPKDLVFADSLSEPFLILGEGTNTVFVDDYQGVIVKLQCLGVSVTENNQHYIIHAGASENWHGLVKKMLAENINGLENLAYIPGSVGAAPVQNIGAYGAEFSDFCESVHCFDILSKENVILNNSSCEFGYRESLFKSTEKNRLLITGVTLVVPKLWSPNLGYVGLDTLEKGASAQQVFDRVVSIRRSKLPDPALQGNAGSFFKNPIISEDHYQALVDAWGTVPKYIIDAKHVKVPAAWLIDQCGFKGRRWGGIQCHPNQPLVLLNTGKARGVELLEAARDIRNKVHDTFSIWLENEVRLIGQNGEVAL